MSNVANDNTVHLLQESSGTSGLSEREDNMSVEEFKSAVVQVISLYAEDQLSNSSILGSLPLGMRLSPPSCRSGSPNMMSLVQASLLLPISPA